MKKDAVNPPAHKGADVTVRLGPDARPESPGPSARSEGVPRELRTVLMGTGDISEQADLKTRSEAGMRRGRKPRWALWIGAGAVLGVLVAFVHVGFEPRAQNSGPLQGLLLGSAPGDGLAVRPGSGARREEANRFLIEAAEAFEKRKFRDARERLVRCLEADEVPECHRRLGLLLAVAGEPGARGHLARYVELVPDAMDAALFRRALQEVATSSAAAR